jgi:hypothetical protein
MNLHPRLAVVLIMAALAAGPASAAGGPLGSSGGPLGSPPNPLGAGGAATGAPAGIPGPSGFGAAGPSVPGDSTGGASIGVDISGAGGTPQTQLSYFRQLPPSQQSEVRSRCTSITGTQIAGKSPGVASFCQTVLGH